MLGFVDLSIKVTRLDTWADASLFLYSNEGCDCPNSKRTSRLVDQCENLKVEMQVLDAKILSVNSGNDCIFERLKDTMRPNLICNVSLEVA